MYIYNIDNNIEHHVYTYHKHAKLEKNITPSELCRSALPPRMPHFGHSKYIHTLRLNSRIVTLPFTNKIKLICINKK